MIVLFDKKTQLYSIKLTSLRDYRINGDLYLSASGVNSITFDKLETIYRVTKTELVTAYITRDNEKLTPEEYHTKLKEFDKFLVDVETMTFKTLSDKYRYDDFIASTTPIYSVKYITENKPIEYTLIIVDRTYVDDFIVPNHSSITDKMLYDFNMESYALKTVKNYLDSKGFEEHESSGDMVNISNLNRVYGCSSIYNPPSWNNFVFCGKSLYYDLKYGKKTYISLEEALKTKNEMDVKLHGIVDELILIKFGSAKIDDIESFNKTVQKILSDSIMIKGMMSKITINKRSQMDFNILNGKVNKLIETAKGLIKYDE